MDYLGLVNNHFDKLNFLICCSSPDAVSGNGMDKVNRCRAKVNDKLVDLSTVFNAMINHYKDQLKDYESRQQCLVLSLKEYNEQLVNLDQHRPDYELEKNRLEKIIKIIETTFKDLEKGAIFMNEYIAENEPRLAHIREIIFKQGAGQ